MDSSKFNLWRASFSFCFIDGFLSPEEANWIDAILKGINLNELKKQVQDDEIQSYHEDEVYQIHNKHSYSERIIKNLMKTSNPGDYVDPNKN